MWQSVTAGLCTKLSDDGTVEVYLQLSKVRCKDDLRVASSCGGFGLGCAFEVPTQTRYMDRGILSCPL